MSQGGIRSSNTGENKTAAGVLFSALLLINLDTNIWTFRERVRALADALSWEKAAASLLLKILSHYYVLGRQKRRNFMVTFSACFRLSAHVLRWNSLLYKCCLLFLLQVQLDLEHVTLTPVWAHLQTEHGGLFDALASTGPDSFTP